MENTDAARYLTYRLLAQQGRKDNTAMLPNLGRHSHFLLKQSLSMRMVGKAS